MGFDANKVEKLSYNFERFKQGRGDIAEPSYEQIADFWRDYGNLLNRQRDGIAEFEDRIQKTVADNKPDDRADIVAEFEAWQDKVGREMQAERRAYISRLCSDNPSVEQLTALPGRIFDAFESYMLEAIQPKN